MWQMASVSDSHRTSGSFRFTVSGGGRLSLGVGAGTTQTLIDTRPTITNTAIRWGELVGLAMVLGTVGTLIVVWRPVLLGLSNEAQVLVRRRFRLLVFIGLAIVLGLLWYRHFKAEISPKSYAVWLVVGISGLLLLGRSLGSHAAASENSIVAVGVILDFIHLAAACLWIGGLISLLIGLQAIRRMGRQVVGRAVTRFSNLALLSVAFVVLTGVFNAWLVVGSIQAFVGTSYGQILLVKSSILVPLLALASVNLLGTRLGFICSFRGRGVGTDGSLGRGLGRRVQGEISLVLLALLMTALLANLPLAKDDLTQKRRASEAPMAMPVLMESCDLNATFGITPNHVGSNTFLLDLTDALARIHRRRAFG